MSEADNIIETEQPTPTVLSHRRILWTMGAVALLSSLAGFIFVSWQFGLGVVLGGVLSLVNYYWLKISLKKIFDQAVGGVRPRFLAVRYFSRYLTLGGILLIVFLTKTVPIVAVILGLGSFALAIVVEGLIRLFSAIFNSKEL